MQITVKAKGKLFLVSMNAGSELTVGLTDSSSSSRWIKINIHIMKVKSRRIYYCSKKVDISAIKVERLVNDKACFE